jgi:phenylacetate-CoA ligase
VEDILKREGKSPQELGFQIIVIRDREGKETLKAEQREKVEGTWGARVQNMLSVPENSFYAMDCAEKSGLHIWEDAFLVEALDERNELVTPGGIGKLTITNLFAEGTPLLRYKTNIDVILNEEVCKCGRTHLRMSYPE